MIIKILFFAIIASLILYRLFTLLGQINITVIHPNLQKTLKDVTNTRSPNLKSMTQQDTIVHTIKQRIADFDHNGFLNSVIKVANLIITTSKNKTWSQVESIVDSRFFSTLKQYTYDQKISNITVKINDVVQFGNNILIKVLLMGDNISEIWSFNRHLARKSQIWYLSDIQKK